MQKEIKWKEYLLKSGLPLEYEIKEYLSKKSCISNFEYTYLREDRNQQLTEFSYDIDSSYIKQQHFVDLMIECKYRHESTKWVFLPEEFHGPDEVEYTSFMHPNDHFIPQGHFRFNNFPYELAPLCSKGIEITSEGPNPKTITQAIAQLSYAMAERITNGILHQVDPTLSQTFGNTVFNNIPIIVTTAKLYRIKKDTLIRDIKDNGNIEDIAINEQCLIIKQPTGVDLERYNKKVFQDFLVEVGRERLQSKLNSFNKDLDFVFSVISKHYSPTCFVVIHHSEDNKGFDHFFDYVDNVINPSKEVKNLIEMQRIEQDKRLEEFRQKLSTGAFKKKNVDQ